MYNYALKNKQKQLLACYEALVENECLTMDHKITVRPELSFMN